MVVTMVEMERSYLTAEVFKEILSQNGRSAELGPEGLIRTLSGMLHTLLLDAASSMLLQSDLIHDPPCVHRVSIAQAD